LAQHFICLRPTFEEHQSIGYKLLRSIPRIGRILALTIIYEIGHISRFETVQKFASYSRLVKCKAESPGKTYGTQGNKIGRCVYFMLVKETLFDEKRFLKR